MAFFPNSIETPQEMRMKVYDGGWKDLVTLSGYAVFSFKGASGSYWKCNDLWIQVGPNWRRLEDVVSVVSLASIYNKSRAINAGWAVDNCRWTTYGGRILLQSKVCVRDSDGYLFRVAYYATAKGYL